MDYSKLTLGELLSSDNEVIRRNAISILKEYQRTIGAITETCNHLMSTAVYENKKLLGYKCQNCDAINPVNPKYQKNKI